MRGTQYLLDTLADAGFTIVERTAVRRGVTVTDATFWMPTVEQPTIYRARVHHRNRTDEVFANSADELISAIEQQTALDVLFNHRAA